MKVLNIIGADLSKNTVDFATVQRQHVKLTNDAAGFAQLIEWLAGQGLPASEVMIVMEHTGHYSYRLEQFLQGKGILFSKVSSLAIKRSLGLVRGKNDRIDAMRIARYGHEKRDQLTACLPADQTVERLKMLHAARQRLVKHRAALINAEEDLLDICNLRKSDVIVRTHRKMIKDFDLQIEILEKEIASVVDTEEAISSNYNLLQSVKGVGEVVALATIIKTGNFTQFTEPRKFACYSGTAPFEHSSGSRMKRRSRVSHLADKGMKTLLHLAARSASQYDQELRAYYQKRLQAGKSKMGTLNIISNKIISRMFAVIKRQTPFIENRQQAV